jgi:hypothetical protein
MKTLLVFLALAIAPSFASHASALPQAPRGSTSITVALTDSGRVAWHNAQRSLTALGYCMAVADPDSLTFTTTPCLRQPFVASTFTGRVVGRTLVLTGTLTVTGLSLAPIPLQQTGQYGTAQAITWLALERAARSIGCGVSYGHDCPPTEVRTPFFKRILTAVATCYGIAQPSSRKALPAPAV